MNWDAATVERIANGEVDWLTMTSPRIVRSLMAHLPDSAKAQLGTRTKLASISPLTSAAARECGLQVTAEACTASTDAVIDAMLECSKKSETES